MKLALYVNSDILTCFTDLGAGIKKVIHACLLICLPRFATRNSHLKEVFIVFHFSNPARYFLMVKYIDLRHVRPYSLSPSVHKSVKYTDEISNICKSNKTKLNKPFFPP